MKTFGERLQEARERRGLSIIKAAVLCQMSDRNYRRYETGERKPGTDIVKRIVDNEIASADELFPFEKKDVA